jgi:hypothetical protein
MKIVNPRSLNIGAPKGPQKFKKGRKKRKRERERKRLISASYLKIDTIS